MRKCCEKRTLSRAQALKQQTDTRHDITTMSNTSMNPIKEEAYAAIGCLYHLKKRYKLSLGFTPEFVKAVFGPYILNKLFRWDGDIQAAVDLWCLNPVEAMKQYGHISKWDVSHVTNMSCLFYGKSHFNEDIRDWDVSGVTTMKKMFCYAFAFDQPIGNWDVSNVNEMQGMFAQAISFNQPIGAWDVSNVTDVRGMFSGAKAFNQPLVDWDVSNVTAIHSMFSYAHKFNQVIRNWDVSKTEDMFSMFHCCPIEKKNEPSKHQ